MLGRTEVAVIEVDATSVHTIAVRRSRPVVAVAVAREERAIGVVTGEQKIRNSVRASVVIERG